MMVKYIIILTLVIFFTCCKKNDQTNVKPTNNKTKLQAGTYISINDSFRILRITDNKDMSLFDKRFEGQTDSEQVNKPPDTSCMINPPLLSNVASFGQLVYINYPLVNEYGISHCVKTKNGIVLTRLKTKNGIDTHFTRSTYFKNKSIHEQTDYPVKMAITIIEPFFDSLYYFVFSNSKDIELKNNYEITLTDLTTEIKELPDTRVFAFYNYSATISIGKKLHSALCIQNKDFHKLKFGGIENIDRSILNKLRNNTYFVVIHRFNPSRKSVNREFGHRAEGQVQTLSIHKTVDFL